MATEYCDHCHNEYPIDRFPNLQLGRICSGCMTGIDIAKAEKALGQRAEQLSKSLTELSPQALSKDVDRVRTILGSIYSEFGGTTGFATQLHWVIMELCKRSKVPASAGQLMVNVLKLHHSVEQAEEVVDARMMTDEQLRREQEVAIMKMTMEAMDDPAKLNNLSKLLEKQGLKLTQMDASERVARIASEIEEQDHPEKKQEYRSAFSSDSDDSPTEEAMEEIDAFIANYQKDMSLD